MPWDETDEMWRHRERDPEDFEPDSFRTIDIDAEAGVHAVIGRLKGETTTTVQSYLFRKEKGWTRARAEQWLEEHGKKSLFGPCERRWERRDIYVRTADGPAAPIIGGYAAVFGAQTELFPGLCEQIAPGAFRETIGRQDVRALVNHDPQFVLGRSTAKTLRLEEDSHGLRFETDVPDTTWARDLMVSMRRGDVTGASFGFRVLADSWGTTDHAQLRTLERVELMDVSVVTFPAYSQAEAALRFWCRGSLDHLRQVAERVRRQAESEGVTVDLLRRRLHLAALD